MSTARGGRIFLYAQPPVPWTPGPGECQWCGMPMWNPDGAHLNGRARHWKDREGLDCDGEFLRSWTWAPRNAVLWREKRRGALACVDCGVVVETWDGEQWHALQHRRVPVPSTQPWGHWTVTTTGIPAWEADHDIPLEDGGPHTLDNLRCRCVPCHRLKTAREAAIRAERRRALSRPRRDP